MSAPAHASSGLQVQVADDQSSLSFVAPPGAQKATPKTIKTGLFELSYVGTLLPHDESTPYFLFTGLPCKTCSAERSLYLIRPSETSAAPQVTSFVQPGKIFDPKSRALVMDSRSFYGHCLAVRSAEAASSDSADDVYIVFQKERVDRRHSLQPSVFVAAASSDFLREKLIERGMPSLSRTLALVKAKKCHEVQGRSRLMVLKPHGLNWRDFQPGDDDDDEDSDTGAKGADVTPE